MPIHACVAHTQLVLRQEAGVELTPRQASILGCIISGLVCAAPEAIKCFLECLTAPAKRDDHAANTPTPCPCDAANADHEIYRGVLHIAELIHDATGQTMTPEQTSVVGCVFSAMVCALPSFLQCFAECMSPTEPPPAGNYDPGDRQRCA